MKNLLLSINPEAKSRLPKRGQKKEEPKPIAAEEKVASKAGGKLEGAKGPMPRRSRTGRKRQAKPTPSTPRPQRCVKLAGSKAAAEVGKEKARQKGRTG